MATGETINSNHESSTWDFSDVEFAGAKSETENKEKPPKYVYRGIHVAPEIFFGIGPNDDLTPPEPPLIDKDGRKTVGDGNEYGVYMTDNQKMATDVYGNPRRYNGRVINKINTGRDFFLIAEPAIGVVYKIDTDETDIHKPWITSYLQGVYNNGYEGEEWVSEKIPKEKYEIISVRMGGDIIHDQEDLTDLSRAEIKARYGERLRHLEYLNSDLERFPSGSLRGTPYESLKEIFKSFYGDEGAAYLDPDSIEIHTVSDAKKKLLAFAHHGEETVDFALASKVEELTRNIDDNADAEEFIEKVNSEIQKSKEKEAAFVERKKAEGVEEPNINGFVGAQNKLKHLLELLEQKQNS